MRFMTPAKDSLANGKKKTHKEGRILKDVTDEGPLKLWLHSKTKQFSCRPFENIQQLTVEGNKEALLAGSETLSRKIEEKTISSPTAFDGFSSPSLNRDIENHVFLEKENQKTPTFLLAESKIENTPSSPKSPKPLTSS
eukprot:Sdes_comp12747_c0_seq1m3009